MPVFANIRQIINARANMVVTYNLLGCNNDCKDEVTTKLVVTMTKLVITVVTKKLVVSVYF